MKLSSEVEILRDEVRRFIREQVDPRSRWIEENDTMPDDLMQMSRDMGLFGLTIPEDYGGSGLDLAGKCAIEEEMGRTNYGFATVIGNHTGISTTGIVAHGNAAQKDKYLPRMASGEMRVDIGMRHAPFFRERHEMTRMRVIGRCDAEPREAFVHVGSFVALKMEKPPM